MECFRRHGSPSYGGIFRAPKLAAGTGVHAQYSLNALHHNVAGRDDRL